MSLKELKNEIRAAADPEKVKILSGFFKTKPGQYGAGDLFLGVTVPIQRKMAGKYQGLPLLDTEKLLRSAWHEDRLTALLILVKKFNAGDRVERQAIYKLYLANTPKINNWDLVDLSAPNIVGAWLLDKKRQPLYRLARSKDLWEKRIAILATFQFIKNGETEDTLKIAEILLHDKHDLIHKAVGWMLREAGKRVDEKILTGFLDEHELPRTALRYAIERLPEKKRLHYLNK